MGFAVLIVAASLLAGCSVLQAVPPGEQVAERREAKPQGETAPQRPTGDGGPAEKASITRDAPEPASVPVSGPAEDDALPRPAEPNGESSAPSPGAATAAAVPQPAATGGEQAQQPTADDNADAAPRLLAMDVTQAESGNKLWRFRIVWEESKRRRDGGNFHLLVDHSYSVPVMGLMGVRKWKKVLDGRGNDLEAALSSTTARCTFYHCTVTEVLDVMLEEDRMRTILLEGLSVTLEADGGERKAVSLPALVGPPAVVQPEAVLETPRIAPDAPARDGLRPPG